MNRKYVLVNLSLHGNQILVNLSLHGNQSGCAVCGKFVYGDDIVCESSQGFCGAKWYCHKHDSDKIDEAIRERQDAVNELNEEIRRFKALKTRGNR